MLELDSTVTAFKTWSQTSIQHRSTILRKWYSLILENSDDLAKILTLEQGKTLEESKKEILYGAGCVEWFAGSMHKIKGKIRSGKEINHKIITESEPVGPVTVLLRLGISQML